MKKQTQFFPIPLSSSKLVSLEEVKMEKQLIEFLDQELLKELSPIKRQLEEAGTVFCSLCRKHGLDETNTNDLMVIQYLIAKRSEELERALATGWQHRGGRFPFLPAIGAKE